MRRELPRVHDAQLTGEPAQAQDADHLEPEHNDQDAADLHQDLPVEQQQGSQCGRARAQDGEQKRKASNKSDTVPSYERAPNRLINGAR